MHKNALLSAWIYIRRDKYRENAEKCKSTDKNEKEWVSFAKLDFDSLLAKIIQCNNAKEKNSTLGPNCLIFGQELLKFNDMKRCGSLSNPTHAKPFCSYKQNSSSLARMMPITQIIESSKRGFMASLFKIFCLVISQTKLAKWRIM